MIVVYPLYIYLHSPNSAKYNTFPPHTFYLIIQPSRCA